MVFSINYNAIQANSFKLSEKLPVPRFVSIKFNEVNARTGPSMKHPIEWVFVLKGEPVEVIAEYEQWRQIRDINGEGGWVHLSALSNKRSVVITGKDMIMLYKSQQNNRVVAHLAKDVRCQLNKCKDVWCKITCLKYSGWVEKKYCWGVYEKEG